MKKIQNYISITLVAFMLFSCNKNEWTPEKEADFKKQFTETAKTKGKGIFSDEQAIYIADCVFEKIKRNDLKPDDIKKPGVVISVRQMGTQCAQEALSKFNSEQNTWNPKTEETYKTILKSTFTKSGVSDKEATFLADCAITKMKAQNISPADLQNPKNGDLVQKIGVSCGKELVKNK
ncbi:hypothetical protein [Flavobacterium defluvii]|uniref:Lipoprotein n=1 Tax=Flavobacterium defluvii TaxID=370979 RepID=A0A1M5FUE2_9FLAO|nr:hypothetical protein [Flavobacterium defluvii]SHF95170.1 hypothetical protein SAMN05443663_101609 [Flavobacterium defluvii]